MYASGQHVMTLFSPGCPLIVTTLSSPKAREIDISFTNIPGIFFSRLWGSLHRKEALARAAPPSVQCEAFNVPNGGKGRERHIYYINSLIFSLNYLCGCNLRYTSVEWAIPLSCFFKSDWDSLDICRPDKVTYFRILLMTQLTTFVFD